MVTLVNSFEGGTNGVTITNANSGGASGNAFDSGALSGSPAFSNTHAAHGALGCEIASSGTAAYVGWATSLGTQTQTWFRQYLYFTANPGGTTYLNQFVELGVANCASILITSAGQLLFWDTSGTTQITSTEAVPLNQWIRVEGFVISSASIGQLSLSIYNSMDSITPTETHTTAANIDTNGGLNSVWFGVTFSSQTLTYWLDDVGVSTTGYLGPVITPGPPYMSSLPNFPVSIVTTSGWRNAGHSM